MTELESVNEQLPTEQNLLQIPDDLDDDFDDDSSILEGIMSESQTQIQELEEAMSNWLTSVHPVRTPDSCPICLSNAPLIQSNCCLFSCCERCWNMHIKSTLDQGQIQIFCPSSSCEKKLSRQMITDIIRKDVALFKSYLKLYNIVNQNTFSKTCPRCMQLYTVPQNKNKKQTKKPPKEVQCSSCSLVWCFRCHTPWHENLTCKQYLKGDKLLQEWINKKDGDQWNARKCPKCSTFIQRNGGCPHMTCKSCSCEFCYLCGRRYFKIPFIGQHSQRYSVFGCPNNLYPKKPWARRAIRGSIATGVVLTSPIIVAGAMIAAIVVLPPVGIYRLGKHIRMRRTMSTISRARTMMQERNLNVNEPDRPNVDEVIPDEDIHEIINRLRTLIMENMAAAPLPAEVEVNPDIDLTLHTISSENLDEQQDSAEAYSPASQSPKSSEDVADAYHA